MTDNRPNERSNHSYYKCNACPKSYRVTDRQSKRFAQLMCPKCGAALIAVTREPLKSVIHPANSQNLTTDAGASADPSPLVSVSQKEAGLPLRVAALVFVLSAASTAIVAYNNGLANTKSPLPAHSPPHTSSESPTESEELPPRTFPAVASNSEVVNLWLASEEKENTFNSPHASNITRVVWFEGPKRKIAGLDVSADGTLLGAASWDGSAYLWSVDDQVLLRRENGAAGNNLTENLCAATAFCWDPRRNCGYVAREGFDTIPKSDNENGISGLLLQHARSHSRTLDTCSLEFLVDRLPECRKSIASLDISMDAKCMVAIHSAPKSVDAKLGGFTVWDLDSGAVIAESSTFRDFMTDVEFSDDGDVCFATDVSGRLIRLDVKENKSECLYSGTHPLNAICVTKSLIYCGDSSGMLRVFNATSPHQLIAEQRLHSSSVTTLDLCSDRNLLMSGSTDTTVKIWRLPDFREYCRYTEHSAAITAVRFSPDGRSAFSAAGGDGSIDRDLFEMANGEGHFENAISCWTIPEHILPIPQIELVPEKQNDLVPLFTVTLPPFPGDFASEPNSALPLKPSGAPSMVEYDGELRYTCLSQTADGVHAKMYDVGSNTSTSESLESLGKSCQLRWDRESQSVVTAARSIDVMFPRTNETRRFLPDTPRYFEAADISPNGKVVVGVSDYGIDVFDVESGLCRSLDLRGRNLFGEKVSSNACDICFAADPDIAYVLCRSSKAFMKNARSTVLRVHLPDLRILDSLNSVDKFDQHYVTDMAVSADGTRIAVSEQYRLAIYDSQGFNVVAETKSIRHRFTCLEFLGTSNSTLIVGDQDGHVEIWDMSAERIVAELPRQKSRICDVQSSPSGDHVMFSTADRQLTCYKNILSAIDLGSEYANRYVLRAFPQEAAALQFSQDNQSLRVLFRDAGPLLVEWMFSSDTHSTHRVALKQAFNAYTYPVFYDLMELKEGSKKNMNWVQCDLWCPSSSSQSYIVSWKERKGRRTYMAKASSDGITTELLKNIPLFDNEGRPPVCVSCSDRGSVAWVEEAKPASIQYVVADGTIRALRDHTAAVAEIALSADGGRLFSWDRGAIQQVNVWDIEGGEVTLRIPIEGWISTVASVGASGAYVAVAAEKRIQLYDAASGRLVGKICSYEHYPSRLVVSPDMGFIAFQDTEYRFQFSSSHVTRPLVGSRVVVAPVVTSELQNGRDFKDFPSAK